MNFAVVNQVYNLGNLLGVHAPGQKEEIRDKSASKIAEPSVQRKLSF